MAQLEDDIAKVRKLATDLFQAGVDAANPVKSVADKLEGLLQKAPDIFKNVTVVSAGKAATKMMQGALSVLPAASITKIPLVITNDENITDMDGVNVLSAGHPLPNVDGLQAANKLAEMANMLGEGDTLLVLISGGASAMLPMPVEGVGLDDKIATTDALLASGVSIDALNIVRKHLSRLKGGGLVRMAVPARVVALILSDVIGDDLSAIASGPTSPDPSSAIDAVEILKKAKLWDDLPLSVRSYFNQAITGMVADTLKKGDASFDGVENHLVGTSSKSIKAMTAAADSMNIAVEELEDAICGEARMAADRLARMVKEVFADKVDKEPLVISAGGETTVTLKGTGKGGRNQEMALAFAIAAELYDLPARWVFLSGGTDGRDGPTDAAGALVDPWTLSRIRAKGHRARVHLNDNDAYHALELSDDLLITGGTGTNVADLQLLILL